MASFSGNIDLLSLNGAKVYAGIDQKNPKRGFVCIPVDLNEIRIDSGQNDPAKQVARLRVNIWPLNENYKNAIRQKNRERGNTETNVPTHEMEQSYSIEYVKAAIKQFPALVEQVKEANKERNPNIINDDPLDENSRLFKAIRNRMNRRIAMLYQPQVQQQPQTVMPSFAQAVGVSSWTPPADPENDPFNEAGYGEEGIDLPF